MSTADGIEKTTNAAILLKRFEKLQDTLQSSNSLQEAWKKVFGINIEENENVASYTSFLAELVEVLERVRALEDEVQQGNKISERTREGFTKTFPILYESLEISSINVPFRMEEHILHGLNSSVYVQHAQNFIANNFYKDRSQIITENILERLEQASISLDGQFNKYVFSEGKVTGIQEELSAMLEVLGKVEGNKPEVDRLKSLIKKIVKRFQCPEFFTTDKIEDDFTQAGIVALKVESLLPADEKSLFTEKVTEHLFKVVKFLGEKTATAAITVAVQQYLK